MNSTNAANLIALLTDFGTRDYFVGAMKGAILSVCANAKIVDITHEIPPQDIASASFTLRACYENFPKQTIFIAVVDPGVGSARRAILVETNDYFFVAPDNGLLSFIFNETEDFRVFELANKKFFAERISRTFHGRDIFAPVAAHLANGIKPEEFGGEIRDFVCFQERHPRKIDALTTEAEIIYIDRFGNLITNLKSDDLPEKFRLKIGETKIDKVQKYFAEAGKESKIFMIAGSAGFLEIAAFRDSAEKLLKIAVGEKVFVVETN